MSDMWIIENITTIVGNVLTLVVEITLVVAIGNVAIQAVSDFDSNNFSKKIRKLTKRLRR
jgi:hypothetical protein